VPCFGCRGTNGWREVWRVSWRRKGRACGRPDSVFAHFAPLAANAWFASTATARICGFGSGSAFEVLTGHDVVLDRRMMRYYLVGAKAAHPALFDGDGMGTKSALETLLARARGLRLSVGFTDPFYDIDVAGDLTRLARNCGLAPARAPRTAVWLKQWGPAWHSCAPGTGDL